MKDFKTHLLILASNPDDRFGKIIAGRLQMKNPARRIHQLRDFVLVLPEMVSQVRAWLNVSKQDRELRSLHGFMLTYLYYPLDFVPEDDQGLFGYLDDAYLVGSVYFTAMNQLGLHERRFLPGLEGIGSRIRLWLRMTRLVLPFETDRIDRMLQDLRRAEYESFYGMMGRDAKTFCSSAS